MFSAYRRKESCAGMSDEVLLEILEACDYDERLIDTLLSSFRRESMPPPPPPGPAAAQRRYEEEEEEGFESVPPTLLRQLSSDSQQVYASLKRRKEHFNILLGIKQLLDRNTISAQEKSAYKNKLLAGTMSAVEKDWFVSSAALPSKSTARRASASTIFATYRSSVPEHVSDDHLHALIESSNYNTAVIEEQVAALWEEQANKFSAAPPTPPRQLHSYSHSNQQRHEVSDEFISSLLAEAQHDPALLEESLSFVRDLHFGGVAATGGGEGGRFSGDFGGGGGEEEVIQGAFGRTALNNRFGSSFANLGFEKHGTHEKNKIVASRSSAVQDGLVLLKDDGTVDRRCAAARNGLLLFDDKGNIRKESPLVQSRQVSLAMTDACHVNSFEVMDALVKKRGLAIPRSDAAEIVRALNRADNLPLKSYDGNRDGTVTMQGRGDRALDEEIINAMTSGAHLSKAAAARARRQAQIWMASDGLVKREYLEIIREEYSKLRDDENHVICRSNAAISSVKEGESRRIYTVEEENDRVVSGRKDDGTPDLRTAKGRELAARAETGLRPDGQIDMRTTKGKALAAQREREDALLSANLHAQWAMEDKAIHSSTASRPSISASSHEHRAANSGLRLDGTPDMRTILGRSMAAEAPFVSRPQPSFVAPTAAQTGLRKDGFTPDLRTRLGQQMVYAQPHQLFSPVAMPSMGGGARAAGSHAATGLTNSGRPDMRTKAGRAMAASGRF